MSVSSQISRISQKVSDSLVAVANKGVTVPSSSTLDDLPDLIASISTGSGSAITISDTTDTHGGTIRTITAVSLAGDTVTAAHLESGYTAHDALGNPITGELSPGGGGSYQAKTGINPSESSQTIEPDTGYDALSSVQINAVSSSYVGSAIDRRDSTDLTASGATVTAPAGYYSSAATKSVSSMTLPTSAAASATSGYSSKATISRSTSDQYINIPTGYNSAGAYYKVNAVANGTEGTPTATKGTVSNHSVTVTPSVTNSAGYISGGTKTGTAVTVSVSELESGNKEITANGTGISVSGYSTVSVAVPGGGGSSKAIYTYTGLATRTANSYGATSAKVTVTKAGTYNISFIAIRGSSSGTMGTNLYIGSTGKGQNTTWNSGTYGQSVSYANQTIAANTDVTIYATSGNNSRTIYVGQLIVEEV